MRHINSFGQALCQTGNDAMPYDRNAVLTDFVHTDCPMCVRRYEDAMFQIRGTHTTKR